MKQPTREAPKKIQSSMAKPEKITAAFGESFSQVVRNRLLLEAIEANKRESPLWSEAFENIQFVIKGDEAGIVGTSGGQHLAGIANLPFTPHGIDSGIAVKILKAGVEASELDWACGWFGLGKAELSQLIGIDRTTATRLTNYLKPLPLHAAEALLRMLELNAIACTTFESPEAARGWLQQPHPMLEGDSPFAAAKTSYGATQVKDLLFAIKYGGVV